MSCVRRVVPVPTLRVAFTDIDCFDALAFGMPPEHDHAMLGRRLPRSNPPVHCPRSQRSRSGFCPVSDPYPTEIVSIAISVGSGPLDSSGRSAISVGFLRMPTRMRPRSSGVAISVGCGSVSAWRRIRPTFRHAHVRHRRLGEAPSRADHQGGVRTQRFRLAEGDPVRPADRHPSWGRPTSGHGRHARAADRRRGAGDVSDGARVASICHLPVGDPAAAQRPGRRHRPTSPSVTTPVGGSVSPADRPSATDSAATSRHALHQHPAHDVRPRGGRPARGVGCGRSRVDTQAGDAARTRGIADRPLEAGPIRHHRTTGGDR